MKVSQAGVPSNDGVVPLATNAPAALQDAQPQTREQWSAVNSKTGTVASMPVQDGDLSASVSSVERLGALQRRQCSSGGVNSQTWSLAACASLGYDSIWKASWQHSYRVSRWAKLSARAAISVSMRSTALVGILSLSPPRFLKILVLLRLLCCVRNLFALLVKTCACGTCTCNVLCNDGVGP